jgi:hypothetical protein
MRNKLTVHNTTPASTEKSNLNVEQKNAQCSMWPRWVELARNATFTYTYIYIYVRNTISFTLNNSVTNLTFTINSKGPKMKLRRPMYTTSTHS